MSDEPLITDEFSKKLEQVTIRGREGQLPDAEALALLRSMGTVVEADGLWEWTMNPLIFRFEPWRTATTIGQISSVLTTDFIAFVGKGRTIEVDLEALERMRKHATAVYAVHWVSLREPSDDELSAIAAVYPEASVSWPFGPFDLHTVLSFMEEQITEGGNLVMFDQATNARLMLYLMQKKLRFAFLERDNGGFLTVFVVDDGTLTVVHPA